MVSIKMVGMLAAAFVAGSFFASPELRAFASTIANDVICSGCVGTSDLANNAVTAAKIKDGEVKAAEIGSGAVTNAKLANGAVNSAKIADNSIASTDIATDAVGADELQGASKLIFVDCPVTNNTIRNPGTGFATSCSVTGADTDDNAVASSSGENCFVITKVDSGTNLVSIVMINECTFPVAYGTGGVSAIVYDQ